MAKSWGDFLTFVLPGLPKVPQHEAEVAVHEAAIEFCERSHLWFFRSNGSDLLAGYSVYGFDPPDGTTVSAILKVAIVENSSEMVIDPMTYDELNESSTGWQIDTGEYPTAYWAREPGVIQFTPIPDTDKTGVLYADVALKPSRSATTGPDFLYDQWARVIGDGARYRLLSIPKRDWSDSSAANGYRKAFESGLTQARINTAKSKTRKSLRAKSGAVI